MSSFTTPLVVKPLDDGVRWQLVEEFEFYIGDKSDKKIVRVPKGFITDFATVPRFAWSLFPPWGKYGKAAVIHDYLLLSREPVYWGSDSYRYFPTKQEIHKIFREGMRVLKVPEWKVFIMYWAVVIWHFFKRRRKNV